MVVNGYCPSSPLFLLRAVRNRQQQEKKCTIRPYNRGYMLYGNNYDSSITSIGLVCLELSTHHRVILFYLKAASILDCSFVTQTVLVSSISIRGPCSCEPDISYTSFYLVSTMLGVVPLMATTSMILEVSILPIVVYGNFILHSLCSTNYGLFKQVPTHLSRLVIF